MHLFATPQTKATQTEKCPKLRKGPSPNKSHAKAGECCEAKTIEGGTLMLGLVELRERSNTDPRPPLGGNQD